MRSGEKHGKAKTACSSMEKTEILSEHPMPGPKVTKKHKKRGGRKMRSIFQKIFVLGAGAIGSALGAFLSQKKDVTLIGNKAHVDAINTHGLIIRGEITRRFSTKAETSIKEVPPSSLIILTTKAQDSAEAITGIKPLLKRGTVILVLQNGFGIKEIIEGIVGDEIEVVRGLVLMAAEFFEPGKITFWDGEIIIEATETGERIATLLRESGLRTRISEDIKKDEWGKLVVNCVINPLTAILRVRNYEIGVDILKGIRHRIVQECIEVGKAEGMNFEPDLERDIDSKILSYKNYSSMSQDIINGKKTEIDFLNGKIFELGKKHDIPTPVNETLVGLIKFLEA